MSLCHKMERDAFERYLFIQNYFDKCSCLWSPILSLYLLICASAGAYYYTIMLLQYSRTHSLDVWHVELLAAMVFFFGLIVFTVAYANGSVDSIASGFQFSGRSDYSMIGGRDAWVEYVANAPIYWYIFGFAITKGWLLSFLGGLASSVVAAAVLAFFLI